MEFNFNDENFKLSPFSGKSPFEGDLGNHIDEITIPEELQLSQGVNKFYKNEQEAVGNSFTLLSQKLKPTHKPKLKFKKLIRLDEENIEAFLSKHFPFAYKRYVISKAIKRLVELDQTANNLVQQKAYSGDMENRYKSLAAFLGEANKIQAKLDKKINR